MILALLGLASVATALDLGELEDCPVRGPEPEEDEVWLVTVGPGKAPYSYLGHTGIWVNAPSRRMNHVIEYGAFDSTQQEPFTNLMRGTLSCRWKVIFTHRAQDRYASEERHAVAQRIALPPEQRDQLVTQLRDLALRTKETWAPFHWRLNSCASEARDYIDAGSGNAWSRALQAETAAYTPREEVMRHVGLHPWAWFGLGALAGRRVDQPQTVWDAGFVPENLAVEARDFVLTWPDGSERPFVDRTCAINRGTQPWPLPEPPRWAPYTALLGALWGGLLVLLGLRARRLDAGRADAAVFGAGVATYGAFLGTFGTVSPLLALVAELEAYRDNLGWLFMNPLALGLVPAGLTWARGRRPEWARVLVLVLATGAVLTPLALLAGDQDWIAPWGLLGLPLVALGALQLRR